jgi:hypothetical protein
MRRSQTQHLGNLLKDYAREKNFTNKLREVDVIQHCHEIMGKAMGRYVTDISMKNGELIIEVNSSIVRSELTMLREELRERINEQVGQHAVTRIVLK